MPEAAAKTRIAIGDLSGGLASAIVAITGNVAAGVIAFAPLGPEYVGQGILAGMLSSIVAGLMAALFGGAPGMISGPKATTSMVFAALLASLLATGRFDLANPESANLLLSLAFGAVLISGSVQVLLGAFRVGGLVKFMPYPVVAGIRNTTAILLIYGQFWPFLGVSKQSPLELLGGLGQIEPATMLVAAVTAGLAWKGSKFMPKPAGVRATGRLEVLELTFDAFSKLSEERPQVAMKIQKSIGRILGTRLRGANALILELDS